MLDSCSLDLSDCLEMSEFTAEELRGLTLFSSLTDEQCALLLSRHLESSHAPDQVFVMEQDWGESVFLLRSGLAKVRSFTADGDEVVMSVLGTGDVFGEMAALDGAPRSADVVALTPLQLVKMRAAPFSALLKDQPSFSLALAQLMASRLRNLNQRFALQSGDATTRMLDTLAYLASKHSPDADPMAEIPCIAQKEIALIAGLARETASRTLSKLRTRGTVKEASGGGLQLCDLDPLRKRGLMPRP